MAGVTWPQAIVALAASITLAAGAVVGASATGDIANPAEQSRFRAAPTSVRDTGVTLAPPVAFDRDAASTYLPTSGNSFSSPVVLTGYEAAFWFNNKSATVQSGEPRKVGAGRYLSRTLWVRWKAPANGTIQVGANSNEDDLGVNVYRGSTLTGLTRVAMNDDQYLPIPGAPVTSSPPPNHPAAVSVPVTKGVVYSIQIGSAVDSSTAAGPGADDLYFAISPSRYRPANDDLVSAEKLTIGLAALDKPALIQGATMELWEPRDVASSSLYREGSIWFAWTPPANADLEITTCADYFKTSTAVFSNWDSKPGNGAGDLAERNFAYDNNSLCGFSRYGSTVTQPMLQGVTYYIELSAVGVGSNLVTVDLHLDATFTSPYIEKISPTSGSTSGGTTVTFTGEGFDAGMFVHFGSKSVAVNGAPSNSFTVKTPSHSAGKVKVTVTLGAVTSNPKTFTYK